MTVIHIVVSIRQVICYSFSCINIYKFADVAARSALALTQPSANHCNAKMNERGKYVFDHIKIDYKLSRGNTLNLYRCLFLALSIHINVCR